MNNASPPSTTAAYRPTSNPVRDSGASVIANASALANGGPSHSNSTGENHVFHRDFAERAHGALHPSSISQGHSQSGTESLKSGAPGRSPGIGDKLAGTAAALVGKAKKNPQKVTEGEMRRDEGKKGIQEAEAEGGHY
ncbi:hypothetical protein JCM16303_000451 [Sporobolomyces ruberrimus]